MIAPNWLVRIRLAAAFGLVGSDVPTVALAGFLVRGGIVLLLLPGVVLPSVIGIAGATGARAFTLSGDATPWFVEVLALVGAGLLVGLVLSVVVGSLVDVWLVRAALEAGDDDPDRSRPVVGPGLIVRLVSIRLAFLVPLAVASIWAGGRVYTATYNELITPSDLTVALPLRVIGDATDAVAVVVVTWLACETIAAIAIRRLILTGDAVWRAIAGALVQVAKRPVWTLLTVASSLAPSGAALFAALFGTGTAYDWVTVAARSDEPIVFLRFGVFVLASLTVAAAWILALALSGITSAWRSAAFTHEVAAALGRNRIEKVTAAATVADRRASMGPSA